MPKGLQPVLQLYLKLLEPLTSKGGSNSDPNQALLTQDPLVPEAVELPEKTPRAKRFAQINGKHYHSLEAPNLRKSLSQWDRVRTWLCLGKKETQKQDPQRPQTEWEQWIGSVGDGEHIFGKTAGIITQKYGEICRITGAGAFGVVLLLHKTQECNPPIDRYYALKVFRRRPGQLWSEYQKRVSAEFSIASSLQHRNIVQAFELLPVGGGNLCQCMEYCAGGDLYSLLVVSGRLETTEADCFFKQLIRGICYMHEMGVAHRDLKPENLLLSHRGCLKISDFGNAECFRFAWETDVHLSRQRCGTGPYISPEQYHDEEFDPRSVDIWSAGIVYVAMRTGRNPWKIANGTDECFRDYLEDRQVGRGYFLMEDISHVSRDSYNSVGKGNCVL
ncbi:kinase-like domain-containing protein [Aspergillus pseudotamarii]|uniref:non-specific serine/threonine protein kinase n=1 Tax=Aspergillus pseudotamarii TaxID=132259 RepID=A0A5N6T3F2_ASPPS|nr:kinase-like domain-containing protein [Aspergillus pseudotamarii]KAE8140840.1 kinase-like domain-containing protein [Aspergillus pseudotamarii]